MKNIEFYVSLAIMCLKQAKPELISKAMPKLKELHELLSTIISSAE